MGYKRKKILARFFLQISLWVKMAEVVIPREVVEESMLAMGWQRSTLSNDRFLKKTMTKGLRVVDIGASSRFYANSVLAIANQLGMDYTELSEVFDDPKASGALVVFKESICQP